VAGAGGEPQPAHQPGGPAGPPLGAIRPAAVNSRLLADAAPTLAPKQQRGPAPPSLALQAPPLSLQALLAVPVAGALRQQFGVPLPAARVAKSEHQPAPAAIGTEPAEAVQLPEPADAAQLDPAAPPADEPHTPRVAELAAGPKLVEPTPMSPGLQLLLATPRVGALRQRFGVATSPRDPLLRPVVEASPPGSPAAPPGCQQQEIHYRLGPYDTSPQCSVFNVMCITAVASVNFH